MKIRDMHFLQKITKKKTKDRVFIQKKKKKKKKKTTTVK